MIVVSLLLYSCLHATLRASDESSSCKEPLSPQVIELSDTLESWFSHRQKMDDLRAREWQEQDERRERDREELRWLIKARRERLDRTIRPTAQVLDRRRRDDDSLERRWREHDLRIESDRRHLLWEIQRARNQTDDDLA